MAPAQLGGYHLISYAGNAEDVVLMRAFADHPDGFYVDVGAGDPISGSLTKNLVDRLGWHGVNIEPLPERHARLRAARPGEVNLRYVVGKGSGLVPFFRIVAGPGGTGGGGLSTTKREILDMHLAAGWRYEELQAETVSLDQILREHTHPGFDLLKIDVEGAEADVLASTDLRLWRPRAIVVEATVPLSARPSHEGWEPALLDAGYVLALFDGVNRFYARQDEERLRERLSVPANVIDNYIPLACAIRAGLVN